MKRNKPALIGASVVALAATALTPTTTASANPDDAAQAAARTGRIVAMALGKSSHLVTMMPDGSDRQRILEFQNWPVGSIDVTDDGSSIAFSRLTRTTNSRNIYTVNSDGSDHQRITSGRQDLGSPTFSPNGERIAFRNFSVDSLQRMKADGSNITTLTNGVEPVVGPSPSWSPDGEYIAFITETRTTQSIVLTDPHGKWFRFVKTFQKDRGITFDLDWSADSSEIVYVRYPRRGSTDIWTVSKNGSTVTRITDTPKLFEASPAYSPDGSAIACHVSTPRDRWVDIVVMDADGTNRDRIETPKVKEDYIAWGG